jgi:hypothetical protein
MGDPALPRQDYKNKKKNRSHEISQITREIKVESGREETGCTFCFAERPSPEHTYNVKKMGGEGIVSHAEGPRRRREQIIERSHKIGTNSQ